MSISKEIIKALIIITTFLISNNCYSASITYTFDLVVERSTPGGLVSAGESFSASIFVDYGQQGYNLQSNGNMYIFQDVLEEYTEVDEDGEFTYYPEDFSYANLANPISIEGYETGSINGNGADSSTDFFFLNTYVDPGNPTTEKTYFHILNSLVLRGEGNIADWDIGHTVGGDWVGFDESGNRLFLRLDSQLSTLTSVTLSEVPLPASLPLFVTAIFSMLAGSLRSSATVVGPRGSVRKNA